MTPQLLDFVDTLDDHLDRAHAILTLVLLAGQRADEFAVDHTHAIHAIAIAEEFVGEARKTVRELDAWRYGADPDPEETGVVIALTRAQADVLRRVAENADPETWLADLVSARLAEIARGAA